MARASAASSPAARAPSIYCGGDCPTHPLRAGSALSALSDGRCGCRQRPQQARQVTRADGQATRGGARAAAHPGRQEDGWHRVGHAHVVAALAAIAQARRWERLRGTLELDGKR
eukprot:scaffold3228_cov384-Prasinococcus_capsulatus_cf.AAC.2